MSTSTLQLRLITTTGRTFAAFAISGILLAEGLRESAGRVRLTSHLLLDLSVFGVHGWPLLILNGILYSYCCWLAFCMVRGTQGRERVFMGALFLGLLLWPATLIHGMVIPIKILDVVSTMVALAASASLLYDRVTDR